MANKNNKAVAQLLDDLISIGQDSNEINRFNKTWKIKLISSEEYLDALNKSAKYKDELTKMYKMQIEILVYAIVAIDGVEINHDDKVTLLNKINPTFVNILYQDFENIRREKDNQLLAIDNKKDEKPETTNKTIEA